MARDWRKVALAVLAAVAVASLCVLGPRVEAQQVARAGKAPAKSSAPAKKDADDEDDDKQPAKKKRQDPAEAQRAIEAAAKLLQAGKAEQAAQSLTAVLAGGNLPPATMAKALFMRGMAYRQESKPAQAISDLTSALWLKGGLTADDRKEALKQRAGAYADAGLTENGEIATGSTSGPREAKERPPAKGWGVTTTPSDSAAPSTTQTAEGGNWFKSWFNNWSPSQAQANTPPPTASINRAEAPPPPAHTPQHAPPSGRVATAWSSSTQVHAETAPAAPSTHRPQQHEAKPDGKYRVQLATVRSHQEALALAAKAKKALAGALASREPEVDQAVLGNMGSFYRVRVGPFATVQETQAVCAKVKGAGFDCLTVTQ